MSTTVRLSLSIYTKTTLDDLAFIIGSFIAVRTCFSVESSRCLAFSTSFLKDIIEFSFPQGRLTDRSFLSEFDQSKSLIHASCESRKTNPVVCLFSCGRREKEIMESCFSPKRERLTRLFVAMENK
jgi:hypothetical protein